MIVKKHRHITYFLVYLLVELALVLLVVIATVERVFSTMKKIKTYKRNMMGNAWLNNRMMIFIQKAIYASMDEKVFQPPLTIIPGSATDYNY